jgi:hypothetical protein
MKLIDVDNETLLKLFIVLTFGVATQSNNYKGLFQNFHIGIDYVT